MRKAFAFTPEAQQDLDDALAWYIEHDLGLAERFLESLQQAIQNVRDFPQIGRPDGRVRRLLFFDARYSLVYRELAGVIAIVAVAHTARRPGYWRER